MQEHTWRLPVTEGRSPAPRRPVPRPAPPVLRVVAAAAAAGGSMSGGTRPVLAIMPDKYGSWNSWPAHQHKLKRLAKPVPLSRLHCSPQARSEMRCL